MRISFNQTTGPKVVSTNGYGYAAKMAQESLLRLGHDVSWRDKGADIEINFIQPHNWYWTGVDYRIGYVPWESTGMPDGWIDTMNEVDEVWTPSPVIAEWFVDAGVTRPVFVYEHGVESIWSPTQRETEGTFRVFHHGAEALRKGSTEAFNAFEKVLWEKNANMTFKTNIKNFSLPGTDRLRFRNEKMPIEELVALYHSMSLMLYPSAGEGFGLTPLQAMATGMPVIITEGWAPYQHLVPEDGLIKSALKPVPPSWEIHHPGKMFMPDLDDLVDKLRFYFENREMVTHRAESLVDKVHSEYDWDRQTANAFSHLM